MSAEQKLTRPQRQLALAAYVVACAFFGYGFMIRVSPAVMVEDLMRDFGVSALVLGHLSAVYLYPYALLQIPIGLWLARFGPRLSMTCACLLVGFGCYVFGSALSINGAYTGRFLIGVGCAMSWPGLLMVVHQWFPTRFALLAGVGQLAGMIGAMLGQAPLAACVGRFGWQPAMLTLSVIGVGISLFLVATVRTRHAQGPQATDAWMSLKTVLGRSQSWLASLFTVSMAAQVLAFGGLWGVPFISAAYGMERTAAAGVVSVMFFGSALGAMMNGWWSDRRANRDTPMWTASLCCLAAGSVVIFGPVLPMFLLVSLVLVWGFGTGGIVIGFAAARDANPSSVSSLAVGLVNTFVVGGGALFQLLIGYLLDVQWRGDMSHGVRLYEVSDYKVALASLMVMVVIGMICIRGTRAR